jgi:hypothetical protein
VVIVLFGQWPSLVQWPLPSVLCAFPLVRWPLAVRPGRVFIQCILDSVFGGCAMTETNRSSLFVHSHRLIGGSVLLQPLMFGNRYLVCFC